MTEEEFGRVSANVFERLSMSKEEAAYLEESTHLQSKSQLWFEHRIGHKTASKFASVSKAHTNPLPIPFIKEIIGESHPGSLSGMQVCKGYHANNSRSNHP